jgi:chitosanase
VETAQRRRRNRLIAGLAAVVAVAVLGTAALFFGSGGTSTTASAVPVIGASVTSRPVAAADGDVDQVIAQMVSVFENGTPDIQYDYIDNLDDGRGYTAGRAGFCTACGDLLTVVQTYTAQVPNNPLATYLPTLNSLAASGDDSTRGLNGFKDAWRTAAGDPVFRKVQDQVTDSLYYAPARKLAQDNGVHSALGVAILVDTAVEQGTDNDPDGLPSMVKKTNAKVGSTPAAGVDETKWLSDFLDIRRTTLENPSSADTSESWGESVGRVDALAALLKAGNLDLNTPFTINPFGDRQTIN